jgi:hypothetical protein
MQFWSVNVDPKYLNFATFSKDLLATTLHHCKDINWLTLFKEIIAVYCENHTKHTNTLCGQNARLLIVEAGGASKS